MKSMFEILPVKTVKALAISAGLSLLAACSGGGGAETTENNNSGGTPPSGNYSGPPPATEDVQRFKLYVWDNLSKPEYCGNCHNTQSPTFARTDDVNLAYEAALTVVTLARPAESRMVTKVGGGHNCWLASASACSDSLTSMITNWAGNSGNSANEVILTAPPVIMPPGSSRTFPADSSGFASTVYPLLTQYCVGCHAPTARNPQSPFFAHADVDTAYAAARDKINLENAADSRLVVRLRSESHNCWDDCMANANTMQAAIQAFIDGIPVTEVDPNLLVTSATNILNGIVASTGGRFDSNVIAKWEFKTGAGDLAYDTSGIDPALNLSLSGNYNWVGGWGIEFKAGEPPSIQPGRAQGSTRDSKKIHNLLVSSGEFAVEAWVAPANVVQDGPARIISYSAGDARSNFTMGQTQYDYNFLLRHSNTGADGQPMLATDSDDERLQATLQHVVMNYDPVNGRRIYVNGEFTGDVDAQTPGTLADWDDTYAFLMGNETDGQSPWAGIIKFAAVHKRSLSEAEILQNYEAGVGERYYLLFNVTDYLGVPECTVNNVPQCYVVVEVSRFDSYAYLFDKPFFASLNANVNINNIPLKGMRIGINGREATVGQAYAKLDIQLNSVRQDLSPIGTTVALENGPSADQFFLTFDQIGSATYVRLDPVIPTPAPPVDLPAESGIGIRTFDRINATLSLLTTVPQTQTEVQTLFETIRQGLPSTDGLTTFSSAHQMGITQLSIEYCNALVEDTSLRAAYFPGFNFGVAPNTAFSTTGRNQIIDPLMARVFGSNITTQPDATISKAELNALIDRLAASGGSDVTKTRTIVKAVCAAGIGGAAMLVQ